jgi:hypothetical protein
MIASCPASASRAATVSHAIADWATSLEPGDLPEEVVSQAKLLMPRCDRSRARRYPRTAWQLRYAAMESGCRRGT